MNLYTTLVVIGEDLVECFQRGILPKLPFAYYWSASDRRGRIVLFPEPYAYNIGSADFMAALFSRSLTNAVVLRVAALRDDILSVRLFEKGTPVIAYTASPEKTSWLDVLPSGNSVQRFCQTLNIFDQETIQEVEVLMTATQFDDEYGYGTVIERHSDIVNLLGLPEASVGVGYESLNRGMVPEGLSSADLSFVPASTDYTKVDTVLDLYLLFARSPGESDGQLAGRFVPDVISWDEDYIGEEPSLGTLVEVRKQVSEALAMNPGDSQTHWLHSGEEGAASMDVDLGTIEEEALLGDVYLFQLHKRGTVPVPIFRAICSGKNWGIWDCQTQRKVVLAEDIPISLSYRERHWGTSL